MPRRVQDIIPADKRSIREVSHETSVPVRVKKPATKIIKKTEEEDCEISEEVSDKKTEVVDRKIMNRLDDSDSVNNDHIVIPAKRMPITPPDFTRSTKKRSFKWLAVTIVAVLIIVGIGYFASSYYSRATFTIVPKIIPVSVNNTFVAQSVSDGTVLNYEVINIKRSATTTVSATNGPVTNTKSSGKVTFYNNYSSQTVRLIAGTRLSAENGLVYRLNSSIVIPGYTKPAGVVVPGKISANISADQPGQKYNIDLVEPVSNLKIVAYSGSPKYSTIYAKPITSIIGGFAGTKKIVNPATLASTTAKLKADLTESLINEAKSSITSGYIMYDKSYVTSFSSPIIGGTGLDTASIGLEGSIYAITLPKSRLIESLAGAQTVSLFSPFTYTAPGLESLNVTITNLKDFLSNKKVSLVMKIKGDIKIVGTIPVDEIKNKLSGISLSATQDIFKSYSPIIESGSGELAPPWANIPTDLNKIKVIIQEP